MLRYLKTISDLNLPVLEHWKLSKAINENNYYDIYNIIKDNEDHITKIVSLWTHEIRHNKMFSIHKKYIPDNYTKTPLIYETYKIDIKRITKIIHEDYFNKEI